MDEHNAEEMMDDAAMRRGLLEMLWKYKKDSSGKNAPPRPMPHMWNEDAWIEQELRRILFPRRKFLGLF